MSKPYPELNCFSKRSEEFVASYKLLNASENYIRGILHLNEEDNLFKGAFNVPPDSISTLVTDFGIQELSEECDYFIDYVMPDGME